MKNQNEAANIKEEVKLDLEGVKLPHVSPDEINALYQAYKEAGEYDKKCWTDKLFFYLHPIALKEAGSLKRKYKISETDFADAVLNAVTDIADNLSEIDKLDNFNPYLNEKECKYSSYCGSAVRLRVRSEWKKVLRNRNREFVYDFTQQDAKNPEYGDTADMQVTQEKAFVEGMPEQMNLEAIGSEIFHNPERVYLRSQALEQNIRSLKKYMEQLADCNLPCYKTVAGAYASFLALMHGAVREGGRTAKNWAYKQLQDMQVAEAFTEYEAQNHRFGLNFAWSANARERLRHTVEIPFQKTVAWNQNTWNCDLKELRARSAETADELIGLIAEKMKEKEFLTKVKTNGTGKAYVTLTKVDGEIPYCIFEEKNIENFTGELFKELTKQYVESMETLPDGEKGAYRKLPTQGKGKEL